MKAKLKKLSEQTIVITGATSGIGLVTARTAARRGARLVLAARSKQALQQLTDEIKAQGGEAVSVVADVTERADVEKIAETAAQHFGGFDTWVNNAGVSIYGKMADVAIEDHRQLFETNFWGVVYGSLTAARHLKLRTNSHGGAIINVGSTLSDRAIPLQGMYCASKHAVKGFTDALRMELEEEQAAISITLVKPAAIDTPYTEHAKNYLEVEPLNPPPVYAPEVVAEVILHCAEHPVREMFAGGGGKAVSALGYYAPRLTDVVMEKTMFDQQRTDRPARGPQRNALYEASEDLRERGQASRDRYVLESSTYSGLMRHPLLTTMAVAGAGALLATLANTRAATNSRQRRNKSLWW
jgi:short-subunit dehydrogenase